MVEDGGLYDGGEGIVGGVNVRSGSFYNFIVNVGGGCLYLC